MNRIERVRALIGAAFAGIGLGKMTIPGESAKELNYNITSMPQGGTMPSLQNLALTAEIEAQKATTRRAIAEGEEPDYDLGSFSTFGRPEDPAKTARIEAEKETTRIKEVYERWTN
jgi:hypothetical protein